jgi:hypothetical protein
MSVKIAFFERNQTEKARKEFQDYVKSLNIPFYQNDWGSTEQSIPGILFYHGSDEIYLREGNRSSSPFRKEIENIYLIEYGGDPTVRTQSEKNIVSYIKYSDLQERLEDIINQINSLTEITKAKLEAIIFAIDPELERRLKPFATLSPFTIKLEKAKDENGNAEIKDGKELTIKDVLTDFVSEKLKIPQR